MDFDAPVGTAGTFSRGMGGHDDAFRVPPHEEGALGIRHFFEYGDQFAQRTGDYLSAPVTDETPVTSAVAVGHNFKLSDITVQ